MKIQSSVTHTTTKNAGELHKHRGTGEHPAVNGTSINKKHLASVWIHVSEFLTECFQHWLRRKMPDGSGCIGAYLLRGETCVSGVIKACKSLQRSWMWEWKKNKCLFLMKWKMIKGLTACMKVKGTWPQRVWQGCLKLCRSPSQSSYHKTHTDGGSGSYTWVGVRTGGGALVKVHVLSDPHCWKPQHCTVIMESHVCQEDLWMNMCTMYHIQAWMHAWMH